MSEQVIVETPKRYVMMTGIALMYLLQEIGVIEAVRNLITNWVG